MIRLGALFAAPLLMSGASDLRPSAPQPATVLLAVVDELSHRPLVNADVIDIATGQHRFTNEGGEVRLVWPLDGSLRLRIRQVGYQPQTQTLSQSQTGERTTVIALKRVAYVMSTVRAESHCPSATDSALRDLSVATLDQLKQGAEKYNEFRRLYPFEAIIERRTAGVPVDGKIRRIIATKEKFSSDNWEPPYQPGRVIDYSFGSFTVPLLFLSTLADSVFWQHHCFRADGVDSTQSTRAVRLAFYPTTDTHGPDYEGTAYLDSATSSLLRVEFHLANLRDRDGPKKLEGYITFMSPSPFVRVPDTTAAVWWMQRDEADRPEFAQRLILEEIRYRKAKPPAR